MYGYEPTWLDIYMNALSSQVNIPMMPMSNLQQPVSPSYIPPVEQMVPQQNIQTNQQPPMDSSIMVGNTDQSAPIDNTVGNLGDLKSTGVM